MTILLPLARCAIRSLQTTRERVPALWRFAAGTLLVVLFAPLWAALRARAALYGPLPMRAPAIDAREPIIFECRLPDMIQTYLYLFGIWEPDVTSYVQRRLQQDDTFIDIGAHVGYFTLLAARRVGPGGRIVSIEAAADMVEMIEHNIAINDGCRNIRTVNAAVSDSEAAVDIYGGPAHNLGLTSTRRHRGMKVRERVPAAPLDKLLSDDELRAAKLIKIDVEGGEDAVLTGIATCIGRLRSDVEILVELSPAWWDLPSLTPREVLDPLLKAGFNVYEIPNDYWPWRYLWPRCIERPRRLKSRLDKRVARLDLVLSRVDADEL